MTKTVTTMTAASVLRLYDEGLRALDQVSTFADCKYWDDRARAMEAWGKIYRSRDVERKGKVLRLRAFAAMGRLAGEIQPQGRHVAGPKAWLRAQGMTGNEAAAARRLSKLSSEERASLESQPRVPAPTTANFSLSAIGGLPTTIRVLSCVGLGTPPAEMARQISEKDYLYVIRRLTSVRDFCNEVIEILAHKESKKEAA